jgi:predicted permease
MLTLLLPFFGLIAIGFAAGRFRLVTPASLAGLESFAGWVALPVLYFHLMVTAPAGTIPGWGFVVATTFATYCTFAIAFSVGALVNGGNVPEATVGGLIGSYSNAAYLGPPLVLAAFGPAAGAPLGLVVAFEAVMLLIVTPLMMALGGTARTDPAKLAIDIARDIASNPVVVAVILGLLVAATGLQLPGPVDSLLTMVRSAAIPVALFVFGASLSFRSLGALPLEVPLAVAVKLVAHPLVIYLLLNWIGGFDPLWIRTAVIAAMLPPAADVVRLATRYRAGMLPASQAVLLASYVAIATVTLTLVLVAGHQVGLLR